MLHNVTDDEFRSPDRTIQRFFLKRFKKDSRKRSAWEHIYNHMDMKDFRLFEITDFVLDEDFIRWIFEEHPDDDNFWNNWLNQNPDKHLIIAEAKQILLFLKIEEEKISDQKLQSEVDRLLHTLQMQGQQFKKPARLFKISAKWRYAVASLLFISITGILYYIYSKQTLVQHDPYRYTSQISSRHLIENINTSNQRAKIALPDGSVVYLAPDSRISYSNSFDSTGIRDVYLSGEAFFSVVKNPERPFRVFSNEIITKVLGTTFTVRSYDIDSVIQITVKTGKVSVYTLTNNSTSREVASKKLGGILLTSNQQLVYAKIPQTFRKIIAESPSIIAPEVMDQKAAYEDVPLEEVFNQLSKAYGIDIVYDSELLKSCTVTADIRNESFYRQLDLVCEAVGARYELMDGQVVIQSKGCQ
ncbi:MAG: FecR family protein [Flavitalea sp.]